MIVVVFMREVMDEYSKWLDLEPKVHELLGLNSTMQVFCVLLSGVKLLMCCLDFSIF